MRACGERTSMTTEKRKRGAPPSNCNAFKHGKYTRERRALCAAIRAYIHEGRAFAAALDAVAIDPRCWSPNRQSAGGVFPIEVPEPLRSAAEPEDEANRYPTERIPFRTREDHMHKTSFRVAKRAGVAAASLIISCGLALAPCAARTDYGRARRVPSSSPSLPSSWLSSCSPRRGGARPRFPYQRVLGLRQHL